MNSMKLKAKLKEISNSKSISYNSILRFYMYDRFIERLSKSEYRKNFILKGGFLLSLIFGVENRSTMDIDTSLSKANFTKENILLMVDDIIKVNIDDGVNFQVRDIKSIRDDDMYGGYRVVILFELDNIKDSFQIDIATGDKITPKAISYKYKLMLEEKYLNLLSYNIETVLAEKLETIFSKLELSSRMKDYYDIYLIYSTNITNIDLDILRKAIKNTFENRKFKDDLLENFSIIKNSTIIKNRWQSYSKKYKYANNISFDEIIDCLEKIISIIEPLVV